MPLYRTGKITLNAGSKVVTGVGTTFGVDTAPGDIVVISTQYFEIFSVESDTSLTLDTNSTVSVFEVDYVVIRSVSTANNLYLMRKIDEFLKDRQVSLIEFRDWVQGGSKGGPSGDGLYPMTDRYGVTTLVKSPEAMQEGLLETLLQADETLALLGGLDSAVAAAEVSALAAASAVAEAEAAATEATNIAATLVGLDVTVKADALIAASSSASALQSKDAASNSASIASEAAIEARSNQQNAESSATVAVNASTTARNLSDAAAASQAAAEISEAATANSANNAAASATTAQDSETHARTYAEDAFNSKNLASASEVAATNKAGEATIQANKAEAERIRAEAANSASQNSAAAASTSELGAASSALMAAQAAADAGGIVLGEVFDDMSTSSIRGWSAAKTSTEITTRIEERVLALPDAVALSLVFGG